MKRLFHAAALALAVSSLVWLAVLWHWRATVREVTPGDIALHLVALPLAVFLLLLALRWAWRSAVAREAARSAALASAGVGAAAPAPAAAEEAQRHATVALMSAHLRCACADSPQALLDAALARGPLPGLDKQLCNADGLPIMSARIENLSIEPAQAELAELALAGGADAAGDGSGPTPSPAAAPTLPPEHVQRALAALREPLLDAAQALDRWVEGQSGPPPRLQVLLAWPMAWEAPQRQRATDWAHQVLREAGALRDDAPIALESIAAEGPELWREADQRLRTLAAHPGPAALLLAACHSDLGEEAVAALEAQRRLFDASRQPKGLIPGEAAAVLLLAPQRDGVPDWVAPPGIAPLPHLHRVAIGRRDKSIEAAGIVGSQALTETLEHALAAARLPADEVAAVACDADGHSGRATELFGTTLKALPQLDASEHLCMTGAMAGHGLAAALMVVALAAERACRDQRPCLGLGLGDPHWRLAVVARPPQPLTDAL